MNHLTDEQLEEALLTGQAKTGHLAACPQCQARLAEKQAIRNRLRAAFAGIHAPTALADRIQSQLSINGKRPDQALAFSWPQWATWVGLAAVLVIGFGLILHFGTPSFEAAAQAELIQVHEANLGPDPAVFHSPDPAKLADHLKARLGEAPRPPQPAREISLRGCCVRVFCKTPVGSYILQTPEGTVSIIALRNSPRAVGLDKSTSCAGCGAQCNCWKKFLGKVNLAAVQRGEFSYYAVGPASPEKLTGLLMAAYPANP